MSFDILLAAVDRYVALRKEMEVNKSSVCYDWDCGIANELGGPFIGSDQQEQLDQAKTALESALNRYIDERIASKTKAHGNE
jgi:hypothetical protein